MANDTRVAEIKAKLDGIYDDASLNRAESRALFVDLAAYIKTYLNVLDVDARADQLVDVDNPLTDSRVVYIRMLLDDIAQDFKLGDERKIVLFDDVVGHADEHRDAIGPLDV